MNEQISIELLLLGPRYVCVYYYIIYVFNLIIYKENKYFSQQIFQIQKTFVIFFLFVTDFDFEIKFYNNNKIDDNNK